MPDHTVTPGRRRLRGKAGLTLKVAMIGAALCWHAPGAAADPEPSTQQQPDEEQQEQEQQQKGISPPRPDTSNNNPSNNSGNPANNDAAKKGDLADKNCWMYSTGPEWFAPGAMPRPGLPGEQVWPCYYVAGLTPH